MIVRFNTDDVEIHLAAAGAGKAGWVEAIIPTPEGNRRFGDLQVGDKVFDRNGNPTTVTGVYPRGFMDAYRVRLSDGRSTICAEDHLWGVYVQGHRDWKYKVVVLKDILKKGVRRADKRLNRALGNPNFYIPAHGVHQYSAKPVRVDPYVFGVFVGNGCLKEKYLTLSSNDEETVKKVADILGYSYRKSSQHNYNWTFKNSEGKLVKTESLFEALYSGEKYIPEEYLYNSEEIRYSLLQGLFDTDGCASCDGTRLHVSYSTTSKRLCDNIRQLLLSVGIVSSVCDDIRENKSVCHNINVNTSKENKLKLFSLTRKLSVCMNAPEAKRNYDKVAIRSVTKLPKQLEMQCIVVDNEEHLYLCEDSIVTHNSTAAMKEITELLKVYRPDEIAFVSFTRKGVEVGIERALEVNHELTPDDLMHFKTLHALSFREAHLARQNIMSASDIVEFNKAFGFRLSPVSDSFGHSTDDDKLLQRYDSQRAGATKSVFVNGAYDVVRYDRLINAYESFKKAHQLVDFFDCMTAYLENGEPLKGVKVFMVDECQDTTPVQWQVIMKMTENVEKIRCFGDDLQTIFVHAGSDPSILVEMAAHYKCVKHEVSYRLPKAVYRFSKGITDMITERVDKDYAPKEDAPEGFVRFDVEREVLARVIRNDLKKNGAKPGRWYCLFRTNCFIDDFSSLLKQFIVPYSDQKGFCIPKRDLARIKRYYSFRQAGYGTEESRKKFMETYKIKDLNDDFMESELIPGKERYYYQDLVDEYGIDFLEKMYAQAVPFCLLSTIHKVKGGEADYTALFMDCTKVVSENIMFDSDSELRILYVGATRCREGLYVIPAKSKNSMQKLLDIVNQLN